ncbi:MAG TPA: HTTM domain-containing protein, partial [Saprospiraceae bacterium]|nr:HTTM domain-containing protein [Saprospiraceae bacterium]
MISVRNRFDKPVSIAPLITLRVVIGAMLLVSTVRFVALGWVDDHYIQPQFHFKYFGFEWVEPLPGIWMYVVHIVLIISSLCVILGLFYRLAAALQFLLFTYTELIDLTYYLNHYYFVSIVCGLLVLVPANRAFSLDVLRKPVIFQSHVPRWTILIFKLQLGIVYFYAGLWKINYDWLVNALPLKIWIPANDRLPLIGWLFRQYWTPWLFAWAGMLYDVSIVFWLSWQRSRPWAYLTVIVFHTLTGLMFQIGVFPLVMIGATLVFFSEAWHNRLWDRLKHFFVILTEPVRSTKGKMSGNAPVEWTGSVRMTNVAYTKGNLAPLGVFTKRDGERTQPFNPSTLQPKFIIHISSLITLFFIFQILFPWRYLLYPGNLFWTEEGYRFCWRVMLMEKAGTATFFVKDATTGREGEVVNSEFLNPHQEKQMAMQPDMILQFAHFLKKYYEQRGVSNPAVRAEVYVTLNARPSKLLIDPQADLTRIEDGWAHKTWILND